MARPSKYKPKVQRIVDQYLADALADPKVFPTLEELASLIGIHTDTVQEWKKNHDTFSVSIKDLLDLQRRRLITGGMTGKYKERMTIFLLKASHGMVETSRQEIGGVDGQPITFETVSFKGAAANSED